VADKQLAITDYRVGPMIGVSQRDFKLAYDGECLRCGIRQGLLTISFSIAVKQAVGKDYHSAAQTCSPLRAFKQ
jgi:hypothetical protein